MTTKLLIFIYMIFIIMIFYSINPVKMSIALIFMSGSIFSLIYMNQGQSWYPLLFMLIFMGGILMMFMILSSVLPNEKSKKMKWMILTLLVPTTISLNKNFTLNSTIMGSKSFLGTGSSVLALVAMMMLYFFFSISTATSEKSPMRSILCHNTLIL